MVLVTGGTGLVGSHLLFDLVKSKNKVRALKRKNSNIKKVYKTFSFYCTNPDELFSRIEWVEGDILDFNSLLAAMEDVTQVYHCAAIVSFVPSDKDKMIKNNVQGTANIVNASLEKKIKKLCYISSTSVIGSLEKENLFDEKTKWDPSEAHTSYSISKYNAELEVWRGINEGLKTVIVNPSVILGPGDWIKGSSGLFTAIWKGFNFYTLGVTGFVDVRDVSKAMIKLMQNKNSIGLNERFIISSENCTYKEILCMIADSLNKKRPFIYVNPLLSNLVWRLDAIKSILINKKPVITKEITKSANSKSYYSNEKIKKTIDIDFIPVKETIKQISSIFLKDYVK